MDTPRLALTYTFRNSEGKDLGLKSMNSSKRRVDFQDWTDMKVEILNMD